MKRLFCILFSVLLLIASFSNSAFASTADTGTDSEDGKASVSDSTSVTIFGKRAKAEVYGTVIHVDENGKVMLQLRCFAELSGRNFSSDVTNGATVSTDSESITFSETEFTKDGKSEKLAVSGVILGGELMISTDDLGNIFNLAVEYNAEKDRISVKAAKVKETAVDNAQSNNAKSKNEGSAFLTVLSAMNKGFLSTLKLFAVTLLGALPLGLLISLGSMSKFKPLRWLMRFLVWIIRGTPLMLQLLIIFYIPGMVMEGGSPWPSGESGRFMAASVAFIINYAFYFSEIFRGGIESVPVGQQEAGQVLGMTKRQIFFHVTLLQMIKRIVPPMSNEIITLVKDTSIARIISLQEVIWAGYSFLKGSHGYSGLLWPLFFTGVYYLLFNGILTILFSKIEKKLSYFN